MARGPAIAEIAGLLRSGKATMQTLHANDLQRQTLRLYGELVCRRESFAGRLVLCCGEGCSASGLPAAVNIAGGTTLAVDPDATAVKTVFRQGGIDFVVNTLDEALRVLKNEIRQRKPLSVGLIAPLETVLAEMVERGVLPDLYVAIKSRELLDQRSEVRELHELESAGMQRLQLGCVDGIIGSTDVFLAWLAERGWVEVALGALTPVDLRTHDAKLLEVVPVEDSLRRNWIQRISHYQRPGAGMDRLVWLTAEEQEALAVSYIDA